jgi:hypothetical protein
METTRGGVLLPDQTGKNKLYGRIVSVGSGVEDKTLRPGDIGVFDANGVRDVRLSDVDPVMFVAISEMMLFGTVSEEYLLQLDLPIPEEVGHAEGLRGDQEEAQEEDAAQGSEEAGSQDHDREAEAGRAATA